ncbi:MAG: hypothetical protein MI924_08230, partial [Chloroflexales bacterium]|nr:hypothetical protein [Chloroflexales bacterium]
MNPLPNQVSSVGEINLKAASEIKNFIQTDGAFVEPDLQQYKPYRFPQPRNIDVFIAILERQHILVLGGAGGVDKTELARHVAWYFSNKRLAQANSNGQNSVYTKEFVLPASSQKVISEIQKTSDTTIFLLTKVTPQVFKIDDLLHLQESAKRHYVVLSTEVAFERWSLHPDIQATFWRELGPQSVFATSDLAEMLIVRLIEVKDDLPPGIAIDSIAPNTPLCGNITPIAIVKKLQTYNKVRA